MEIAKDKKRGKSHTHVVGVAGVGMSAIAQALIDQGHTVSGSDRYLDSGHRLLILDQLERAGIRLVPQDGSGISKCTEAVVVSTAIEDNNPDLMAASKYRVPVIHRAVKLAQMVEDKPAIAVTGTAGKTTVTGMLGYLLEQVGEDPWVVNGGAVVNWACDSRVGNVRKGGGTRWVFEADESDRSLLHFHPEWAVITNFSKDHFLLDEVVELFRLFATQVQKCIVCGPGVAAMLRDSCCFSSMPEIIDVDVDPIREGHGWTVSLEGTTCRAPMPGRHNALNAALALCMGHEIGLDARSMLDALPTFRGVERRLQVVGDVAGVQVLDDYAHNPAKIAATWRTVAETRPRILGVWRPHGFGPLALMMDELVTEWQDVCRPDDRLYLLPVYDVGGTASRDVSSNNLATKLSAAGVQVQVKEDYGSLLNTIRGDLVDGDAVVVMGARDPGLSRFAHVLVGELVTAWDLVRASS